MDTAVNSNQSAQVSTRQLVLARSVELAAEAFARSWQKQQTNLNRVPVLQDRLDQLQAKLDELKAKAP